MALNINERFDAKVQVSEHGCWLWQASKRNGYGQFAVSARDVRYAHRFSFSRAFGDIPQGMIVCHKCDVPACVRPDHLFLGTYTDNMVDAVAKGRISSGERHSRVLREVSARGSSNRMAKLTESQVAEIRARRKRGELARVIALDYGIAGSTVDKIHTRETWKHLA